MTDPKPLTREELHMYTDGSNWVIAETPEQATDFYLDHIGMARDDFDDDDEPLPDWIALPPNDVLGFYVADDGDIGSDGDEEVTKTVAKWIAEFGARYMGSEL